jgi:HTH-type transcriptional regulator/antitoxin HigA
MQAVTFARFAEIRNDADHDAAVEHLIQMNRAADAEANLPEIKRLGALVEQYEIDHGHTPDYPRTLAGILELEMYKRKLKQRGLAQLLELHETRLSELLKGKRKLNIDIARSLYNKLNIDPALILTLQD